MNIIITLMVCIHAYIYNDEDEVNDIERFKTSIRMLFENAKGLIEKIVKEEPSEIGMKSVIDGLKEFAGIPENEERSFCPTEILEENALLNTPIDRNSNIYSATSLGITLKNCIMYNEAYKEELKKDLMAFRYFEEFGMSLDKMQTKYTMNSNVLATRY